MSEKRKSLGRRRKTAWRWVGFGAPVLFLVVLISLSAISEPEIEEPTVAPDFELRTTNGESISLNDVVAKGDTLLYFSMGVGCDGCFAQIPELEATLAQRGMTLLPIMVDSPSMVAEEAARFGIETPILLDPGARVSSAYGMLGVYGHGDRPSHSFALVRQDGTVGWVRHYAEMFVPSDALFDELDRAVGA